MVFAEAHRRGAERAEITQKHHFYRLRSRNFKRVMREFPPHQRDECLPSRRAWVWQIEFDVHTLTVGLRTEIRAARSVRTGRPRSQHQGAHTTDNWLL